MPATQVEPTPVPARPSAESTLAFLDYPALDMPGVFVPALVAPVETCADLFLELDPFLYIGELLLVLACGTA